MMKRCWLLAVLLLSHLSNRDALAERGGDNLLGHRGLVRTLSAINHPAGLVNIGTDLQYFKASDLLSKGEDHSRMVNTFTVGWAPIRFIEAALGFYVISDSGAEELQVAVGDPHLSLKGGYQLPSGLGFGGTFDIRFPSGVGFFEPAASASIINFAALASWSGGSKLPLSVHLNFGMAIDGSQNLFSDEDLAKLSTTQQFAAQVSSFNRIVSRLGVEYDTRYVGPFVEFSLEPFLGSGAPGFGDSPGLLTLGARVWPTKERGLQMLAAVDIGLMGVGNGEGVGVGANKYAPVLPRWNLIFRVSYRFDPFAKSETATIAPRIEKPEEGIVVGVVVDETTNQPVNNARVRVNGQVSDLAVGIDDGRFRTFKLDAGRQSLTATADGYLPGTVDVEVEADGEANATIRLKPKKSTTPGTIRGEVKAIGSGKISATVLIPELDRTVQVGPDGAFTIQVRPGAYTVVISAEGFRTQRKKLTIREGSTVILNAELHRR